MPRRPSRTVTVAVSFDPSTVLSSVSSSALSALQSRPFGEGALDRSLAHLSRWFLYTPGRQSSSGKPLPVRILRWVVGLVLLGQIAFVLTTSTCLFLFKWVNPGATTLMAYREIGNGWKVEPPRYVPMTRIPRTTRTMTIRVEDGSFFEHRGILLAAMKNAYRLNKAFGEPVYGGSTITMQTARTIFLVPAKSYFRKYLEVIIALEMEAILGKDRILELYFNYAEWGKGIFGIEAASRYHYKTGVAALSRDQAIRLVTLLSSPIIHGPYSFGRNGILRARYEYLASRWGEDQGPPAPSTAAGLGTAPIPALPPGDSSPGQEGAPGTPPGSQGPGVAPTETAPAGLSPAGGTPAVSEPIPL